MEKNRYPWKYKDIRKILIKCIAQQHGTGTIFRLCQGQSKSAEQPSVVFFSLLTDSKNCVSQKNMVSFSFFHKKSSLGEVENLYTAFFLPNLTVFQISKLCLLIPGFSTFYIVDFDQFGQQYSRLRMSVVTKPSKTVQM